MAAPTKQGIDYFPYDIDLDQDDKLAMIIGEYGEKGERLWVKILAWTYKNEGYYFEWKEDVQLRFLRRYSYCGFSLSFIQEVVPRFIRWGLFDKAVFDAFQILTSERIQKTWLDATRKRIGRQINQKFWLNGVNDAIAAEETPLTAEVTDKEKESKENEIKEKEEFVGGKPPAHEPVIIESDSGKGKQVGKKGTAAFVPPTQEEVQEYFLQLMGDPKKPNAWPRDKCFNEGFACFHHYNANGWKQGTRAKPIVNWKSACCTWMTNEKKGVFGPTSGNFNGKSDKNTPENVQKRAENVNNPPQFEKMAIEISYLYERFLEDKCTITSIEYQQYDYLKNGGALNFTDEQKMTINKKALEQLAKINIPSPDEKLLLTTMKKIGVLEYFSLAKSAGWKSIFNT